MTKRSRSVLTEKQEKYVEARLDGKNKSQAAKEAGYSSAIAENSPDVQAALLAARSELSSATQIRRADVLEMFKEAYDMGKLAGESTAMTAAAREIGKMLGFYEPERIKIELTNEQMGAKQKYEIMSDEELLQLASGTTVEGECRRVN